MGMISGNTLEDVSLTLHRLKENYLWNMKNARMMNIKIQKE